MGSKYVRIDLSGKLFGRLTALRCLGVVKGNTMWECRCVCGAVRVVSYAHLSTGHTKSCGCRQREVVGDQFRVHGKSRTRTWRSWVGMRNRCSNPNNHKYYRYGARGIKVCSRWDKFENFLADMGECPTGHSIERRDNDGDYTPENCIWALPHTQNRNRSTTVLITAFGRTQCITDWSRETGHATSTIQKYLALGKSTEEILSSPRVMTRGMFNTKEKRDR